MDVRSVTVPAGRLRLPARLPLAVSAGCFTWLAAGLAYFDPKITGSGDGKAIIAVLSVFGAVCAAVLAFCLLGRPGVWTGAFRRPGPGHAALLVLAGYTAAGNIAYMSGQPGGAFSFLPHGLVIVLSVPAIYVFYYCAYKTASDMFGPLLSSLELHEAVFWMLFSLAAGLAAVSAFLVFPVLWQGTGYGVVYTFDSQQHFLTDVFFLTGAPENDVRNPFFGLFSMPFTAPCRMFASAVALAAGTDIYAHCLAAMQALVTGLAIVMLSRMACKDKYGRAGLYILFSCSYAVLLNAFILEQYAFSIFWLVSFLYFWHSGSDREAAAAGVLAAGCLSASVLALVPPLLSNRERSVPLAKRSGAGLAAAAVLSGQAPRYLVSIYGWAYLYFSFCRDAGSISGKLLQFAAAARSVFLQPPAGHGMMLGWDRIMYDAYLLDPVASLDVAGALVLALSAVSAVLNRKDPFCRSCAWWAFVSFLVTCLAGWGTADNELVLYALYFGWAHICLLYKLAERTARGNGKTLAAACAAAGAAMLAVNVPGLSGMFRFLAEYYPA